MLACRAAHKTQEEGIVQLTHPPREMADSASEHSFELLERGDDGDELMLGVLALSSDDGGSECAEEEEEDDDEEEEDVAGAVILATEERRGAHHESLEELIQAAMAAAQVPPAPAAAAATDGVHAAAAPAPAPASDTAAAAAPVPAASLPASDDNNNEMVPEPCPPATPVLALGAAAAALAAMLLAVLLLSAAAPEPQLAAHGGLVIPAPLLVAPNTTFLPASPRTSWPSATPVAGYPWLERAWSTALRSNATPAHVERSLRMLARMAQARRAKEQQRLLQLAAAATARPLALPAAACCMPPAAANASTNATAPSADQPMRALRVTCPAPCTRSLAEAVGARPPVHSHKWWWQRWQQQQQQQQAANSTASAAAAAAAGAARETRISGSCASRHNATACNATAPATPWRRSGSTTGRAVCSYLLALLWSKPTQLISHLGPRAAGPRAASSNSTNSTVAAAAQPRSASAWRAIARPTKPVPLLYRPAAPCLLATTAPASARRARMPRIMQQQRAHADVSLRRLPALQAAASGGVTLPMLPPVQRCKAGAAPGGGLTLPMLPPISCHACGSQLQLLPPASNALVAAAAAVSAAPACPAGLGHASANHWWQQQRRRAYQLERGLPSSHGSTSSAQAIASSNGSSASANRTAPHNDKDCGSNGLFVTRGFVTPAAAASVNGSGGSGSLGASQWVSTWVTLPMLLPTPTSRPPQRKQQRGHHLATRTEAAAVAPVRLGSSSSNSHSLVSSPWHAGSAARQLVHTPRSYAPAAQHAASVSRSPASAAASPCAAPAAARHSFGADASLAQLVGIIHERAGKMQPPVRQLLQLLGTASARSLQCTTLVSAHYGGSSTLVASAQEANAAAHAACAQLLSAAEALFHASSTGQRGGSPPHSKAAAQLHEHCWAVGRAHHVMQAALAAAMFGHGGGGGGAAGVAVRGVPPAAHSGGKGGRSAAVRPLPSSARAIGGDAAGAAGAPAQQGPLMLLQRQLAGGMPARNGWRTLPAGAAPARLAPGWHRQSAARVASVAAHVAKAENALQETCGHLLVTRA